MKFLSIVLDKYKEKRDNYDLELSRRKSDLYKKVPELLLIDRKLCANSSKVVTFALDNSNTEQNIEILRKSHKELLKKREDLLIEFGFSFDYLNTKFDCKECKDYGYINTELCSCVIKKCEELENLENSSVLNTTNQTFANFNLELYSKIPDTRLQISPYTNTQKHLLKCMEYASSFNEFSGNLLLVGAPGLSKTFLSSCIAQEVLKKSYSVVYDTASNVFDFYETKKFKDKSNLHTFDRYTSCDLLIIDDLATELITNFTTSALYTLLNERIMSKKPMIINTNYSIPELLEKYSPAIASRLSGEFKQMYFFGDDLRQKLKKN